MFTEDDFADRLSKLRGNTGISARDMSLSLGMNPSYINTIENGKSYPTMSKFFSICDLLEVEPSDFFDLGISDPKGFQEIVCDMKKLDVHQLNLIAQLIKELAK